MTPLIAARRYFWGAYSFSTLGRFVHGMALSWVVWTQTHSPLWLSAIAELLNGFTKVAYISIP